MEQQWYQNPFVWISIGLTVWGIILHETRERRRRRAERDQHFDNLSLGE